MKFSLTRSASTRSALRCPRFCASRAASSWRSSRSTDLSAGLCSELCWNRAKSSLSVKLHAMISLSSLVDSPSLPLRRRPRRRPLLPPKRRNEPGCLCYPTDGWIPSSPKANSFSKVTKIRSFSFATRIARTHPTHSSVSASCSFFFQFLYFLLFL